jgi:hypothetical protein
MDLESLRRTLPCANRFKTYYQSLTREYRVQSGQCNSQRVGLEIATVNIDINEIASPRPFLSLTHTILLCSFFLEIILRLVNFNIRIDNSMRSHGPETPSYGTMGASVKAVEQSRSRTKVALS